MMKTFPLIMGLFLLFFAGPLFAQDSLVTIKPSTARYFLEADDERWVLREKDSLSTVKISTQALEIKTLKDKIVTYQNDSSGYAVREKTQKAILTYTREELKDSRSEVRKQKVLKYLGYAGIIIALIL